MDLATHDGREDILVRFEEVVSDLLVCLESIELFGMGLAVLIDIECSGSDDTVVGM